MGSSSPQPVETRQTTDASPWKEQQPYLKQIFGEAQRLYNDPTRPQFYQGQTFADPSQSTLQGLAGTEARALQGSPVLGAAQSDAINNLGGAYLGANPANAIFASGARASPAGRDIGYLRSTYGSSPTGEAQGMLRGLSAGSGATNEAMNLMGRTARGEMLTQGNPYFQQMADRVSAEVLPRVQGSFGRALPGGLQTRAATLALGDALGSLAYQDYGRERASMDAAQSNLASTGLADLGARSGIANQLGALGLSEMGQKLGAAGQAGSLAQSGLGLNLQAAQGLSGAYGDERNRMTQYAGMAPQLAQADYLDPQMLQAAGAQREAIAQKPISEAMARHEYENNLPQAKLADYLQMVQGNYGGTTNTTGMQFLPQANPFGQVLGGLMGGVGLLGGTGAFGPSGWLRF